MTPRDRGITKEEFLRLKPTPEEIEAATQAAAEAGAKAREARVQAIADLKKIMEESRAATQIPKAPTPKVPDKSDDPK